jgi:hypothetical protein
MYPTKKSLSIALLGFILMLILFDWSKMAMDIIVNPTKESYINFFLNHFSMVKATRDGLFSTEQNHSRTLK